MPKYRKRPGTLGVYVPGIGLLTDNREIEGDYELFVPSILVRVEDPNEPYDVEIEAGTVDPAETVNPEGLQSTESELEPAELGSESSILDSSALEPSALELSALEPSIKEQAAAAVARSKKRGRS